MSLAPITAQVWNLPVLGRLRRSSVLNALLRKGYGHHWGRFDTREEALAFLPPSRRKTYDCAEIAQLNIESFAKLSLFDWPVIYFLQKTISCGQIETVVDYGGHVGVKYHAYKDVVDLPRNLRWQIVDVPAVCQEGRRRHEDDPGNLLFFENLADTKGCDILICSGVLQYSDLSLDVIVRRLPARPRLIILNKVGVVEHRGYFTLESYGSGRMPYQVFSQDRLGNILQGLGYRKLAGWMIPERNFSVPSQFGTDLVREVGEAWEVLN